MTNIIPYYPIFKVDVSLCDKGIAEQTFTTAYRLKYKGKWYDRIYSEKNSTDGVYLDIENICDSINANKLYHTLVAGIRQKKEQRGFVPKDGELPSYVQVEKDVIESHYLLKMYGSHRLSTNLPSKFGISKYYFAYEYNGVVDVLMQRIMDEKKCDIYKAKDILIGDYKRYIGSYDNVELDQEMFERAVGNWYGEHRYSIKPTIIPQIKVDMSNFISELCA